MSACAEARFTPSALPALSWLWDPLVATFQSSNQLVVGKTSGAPQPSRRGAPTSRESLHTTLACQLKALHCVSCHTAIQSSSGSPAWEKLRIWHVHPFWHVILIFIKKKKKWKKSWKCMFFLLNNLSCNQIPSRENAKTCMFSIYKNKSNKKKGLYVKANLTENWLVA